MKPYWRSGDGRCLIYCADYRDVLPTVTADVVISDPPYSERTHRGAQTNTAANARAGYKQGGTRLVTFDSMSDKDFVSFVRLCLASAGRWVVLTCDHRHASLTFDWPEHVRLGAWCKVAPMPQISGDRPGSGHEAILVLHNPGRKRWNGGGRAAVYYVPPLKVTTLAPTQKPNELLRSLVSDFTDPGETVLDPCMGVGTTGMEAVRLGRRFVGVEINETRCRQAAERIGRVLASPHVETLGFRRLNSDLNKRLARKANAREIKKLLGGK